MAKRHSRPHHTPDTRTGVRQSQFNRTQFRRENRNYNPFANDLASLFGINSAQPNTRDPYEFSDIQDRRTWDPAPLVAPRTLSGRQARVYKQQPVSIKAPQAVLFNPVHKLGFKDPKHVLLCLQRNIRKEVLHALGKTGRGGSRRRIVRRNENSAYSC